MLKPSPSPEGCIEIFLQPGDFYFGDKLTRIRTILGSCVSITLWHPLKRIGGMCHYLLPTQKGAGPTTELDGRYADDAMRLFLNELKKTNTWPVDYEVKMFGGGDQFPDQVKEIASRVPDNNIAFGRSLLKHHGFSIKTEHLGGTGHRSVIFDVWSGEVWIKHTAKN
jgi:chemotaxis protein CheD